MTSDLRPATRADLAGLPLEVAPRLLGGHLATTVDGQAVTVRLSEVEAYHGRGTGSVADPGSHARMGPTARNATMWGEPGHLYVYLSHGIHSCINVVCGPPGVAGVAGTDAFPWRFWIAGDPTVSSFRWGRGAQPAARPAED